ncbi:PAS domain S-box protein [Actinoplanes sp. NPDC049596]|uniref:PAS domain S-box protein n=1 Tax=unclassified Actinoplanes TaxID=2626549 RepID=UPI00343CF68F
MLRAAAPPSFGALFESSPIGMAVVSLDGEWVRVNPAIAAMLGYTPAELLARRRESVVHPEDVDNDAAQAADLVAGRIDSYRAHKRYRRRHGGLTHCLLTVTLLRDDDGAPAHFLTQLLDVTATLAAQQAHERSEEQFRTAFDGSPIGLLIADEHGRFRRANPAAAALTGRSVEELIGLTHREITDPADIEASARARLALLRGATDVRYDNRLRHADGRISWTRVSLSLIPGPDGRRWRLVQLQDITAERDAALAAEREGQRLRATLVVQRDVTAAAADRDAALRVVAARAVELFEDADGATVELAEGDDLVYAATAGTLAAAKHARVPVTGSLSGQVLTTGAPAHCADTSVDPRVDRAACERHGIGSMMIAPLYAENRVIGCLKVASARTGAFGPPEVQQLALLADSLSSALQHADDAARNSALLAERTHALALLEASETRFRMTFDNSPLGLGLISLDGGVPGRYLQANPAMTAITGYSAGELLRMTYADLVHPDDRHFRSSREVVRYLHKDGHEVWVSSRTAEVHDDTGRPLYLVSQIEDVTAQRAAEAQLRRQARLLELIPAAVIVRDRDGTIRWWNTGAEQLYGWPLAAVAGKNIHRLLRTVFPDDGTAQDALDGLVRAGHWDGQLEHLTAAGRVVTVLSRQVLHLPADQVLEINTDVTAARAAEQALAESEQRFRAQFTHSAAGQAVYGLDGSLMSVNPAYAAMLGHTVEHLVGRPDRDFVHPDDLHESRRHRADLFTGERDAYTQESRLRHADGHWVDVSATFSVVREAGGRPKHLIGVFTDISARRAAEADRDRSAAALAERNAELEAADRLKLDIIGMLGHEIGNPLSSIRGYAEVLTDGTTDAMRERAIEAIARQAGRLDDIVREVLAMVSIDAGSLTAVRQEVDLRDQIAQALVAMDLDDLPVHGENGWALCNPGHLQQILANLLSNAAKYGGGATAITLSRTDSRALVSVADSGPGVPAEFRPRLFERLARAERDATSVRGTGLGLYIVRGLARANEGDIRHVPNPTGGSIFVLDLEAAPS